MKKYSILVIAAVLLIVMAFAGAASADNWIQYYNETWYDAEGGSTATEYHIYDAESLAALSEKVMVNESPSDFHGKTIFIMNDINLAEYDWTPIGNETYSFNGTVDGNYRTISGFNIEEGSSNDIGLIGVYAGTSIKNLTLKNYSVLGNSFVGGLVGKALGIDQIFENVTVEFGNVTGSASIGGLVGSLAAASANIINCTAKNCVVNLLEDGSNFVGGLLGSATCVSFDICKVVNSSVSGNIGVGGLVGSVENASGSPFMRESSVTNCIVSSGNIYVGGLVGAATLATESGIAGCMVENSTIVSISGIYGGNLVGGLVGGSENVSVFNESISEMKGIAVRGLNSGDDYIGKIIGCDGGEYGSKVDSNENVTCDSNIWLNNNSNADYPKIYIAKSTNPEKQGPEVSDYFNNDTVADAVPAGAKLVTQLTGYGPNGKYAALAYVFEPPTLYSIYITNATGTYQLTSLLTTVCGDYGNSDNGTAVLTFDTESKPVLTLNGFKASNMSGVPIINTSVADLTIKLADDSNLTGGIKSSGKLTIVKGEDGSELVVNNTASSSTDLISINANSLTIDNAKVTVIANNTGSGAAYATFALNLLITGSDAVVEANATSVSGNAYSLNTFGNIEIENAKVTATAETQGSSDVSAHGLFSWIGSITISDSANVIAKEKSNNRAYAISAKENIAVTDANIIAKAEGKNETFAIVSNNNTIQIADGSEVDAYAASSAGNASAIIAHAKDITIDSGAQVIANASAFENAFAIKSEKSNVLITGANTVVKANSTSSNTNYNHPYNAFSIIAEGNLAIDSGADVSACAHHTGYGAAISLSGTDIGIADTETVIFAEAESSLLSAIAFFGNNITVTSVKKLTAIGSEDTSDSSSSFGYNLSGTGSLDMAGLSGYAFSNATVSGAEPKSYATFIAPGNWHTVDMGILSNYTAVTIEKKDTPTPSYSGSTKQTGYTQIVQNVPTITPTVAPTATPTQAPSTPSAPSASSGQAAQPTQSSPVPVAGIIAGFGAAALVLTRLRR